jgi:hypothetical protein
VLQQLASLASLPATLSSLDLHVHSVQGAGPASELQELRNRLPRLLLLSLAACKVQAGLLLPGSCLPEGLQELRTDGAVVVQQPAPPGAAAAAGYLDVAPPAAACWPAGSSSSAGNGSAAASTSAADAAATAGGGGPHAGSSGGLGAPALAPRQPWLLRLARLQYSPLQAVHLSGLPLLRELTLDLDLHAQALQLPLSYRPGLPSVLAQADAAAAQVDTRARRVLLLSLPAGLRSLRVLCRRPDAAAQQRVVAGGGLAAGGLGSLQELELSCAGDYRQLLLAAPNVERLKVGALEGGGLGRPAGVAAGPGSISASTKAASSKARWAPVRCSAAAAPRLQPCFCPTALSIVWCMEAPATQSRWLPPLQRSRPPRLQRRLCLAAP